MSELEVQKYLREGNTIASLKERFAISAKEHPEYSNLVLLKYSQIESPFSEQIVRECRGLILDSKNDWEVVCFSMPKFFNHGEGHAAQIDWKTAKVYTKEDGSLCQAFVYDEKWQFASSGSPDGGKNVGDYGFTFNELFWKTFTYKLPPVDCRKCFFFELTSIYNKIVVVHPEPSITLLGGRDLATMKELTIEEAHAYFPECKIPKQYPLNSFEDIIKSFDTFSGLKMEGYVVADGQFNRCKIKHPGYTAAHHLKDSIGGSQRAMVGVVLSGEIDEVCATLPEYKEILTEAKSRLDALVIELEYDYSLTKDILIQKDFALAIQSRKTRCPSALFSVRAKKAENIRAFLQSMQIDSVVNMLGYKTSKE